MSENLKKPQVLTIRRVKRSSPGTSDLDEKKRRATTDDAENKEDVEFIKNAKAALLQHKIELRKSTIPNAGYGVFATEDIKMGDELTWYAGQIVPHKDVTCKTHTRSLFSQRWAIDGTCLPNGTKISQDHNERREQLKGTGLGAFFNHADGEKKNAEFVLVDAPQVEEAYQRFLKGRPFAPDPKWRIIVVKATKHIRKGEEIFVSYGHDYWQREHNKST